MFFSRKFSLKKNHRNERQEHSINQNGRGEIQSPDFIHFVQREDFLFVYFVILTSLVVSMEEKKFDLLSLMKITTRKKEFQ